MPPASRASARSPASTPSPRPARSAARRRTWRRSRASPILPEPSTPAGIPGSRLPGPFPVGAYADRLRERLRELARVQVFGELWNLRMSRASVYFELRDARGALPCSMWRSDFDQLGIDPTDGAQVVVA